MPSPMLDEVFEYEALAGPLYFRLLELKQGEGDDPLDCELQSYELRPEHHYNPSASDVPEFQAVSYVWGPDPATHNIQCNGKPFRITESLRYALDLIRRPDVDIFVWADAICINQSDLKERKQQVALMRSIFSRAETVFVCINLDRAMSTRNQRFLASLLWGLDSEMRHDRNSQPQHSAASWAHVASPSRSLEQSPSDKRTSRRGCRALAPFDDQSWQIAAHDHPSRLARVCATFFDNPWFSRIWVVQEVAVSKECSVLFDGQEIPWRNIVLLARWILVYCNTGFRTRVLRLAGTNGLRNVLFMHSGVVIGASDPIPALLQSTRDFGATDPRDKVYAVLHKPLEGTFIHRYTKFGSLSPTKYAQFLVTAASLLCLLSAALTGRPSELSFWATLFSLGYIAYFQFLRPGKIILWDFAGRLIDFCLRVDRVILHRVKPWNTLQNALSLTADYSLPVQTVYRTVAKRVSERTRRLDILSYVNHGSDIDNNYPSWVPRWDTPSYGVHVLISLPQLRFQASGNTTHSLNRSSRPDDHLVVEGIRLSTVSWISRWNPALAEPPSARHLAQNHDVSASHSHQHPAEWTPNRIAYGRRRFMTTDAALGYGPQAMMEGDIVCVLFGGRVPYILRSTDTDNLYRVVGESYVQGIMMGKAVDLWREGMYTKETFILC